MLLNLPCDGVIELYTLVELNLRASRFCFAVAQWSTFIYFETQLSSHLTASNFLLSFFHFQQELIVWYLFWNSLEQLWATLQWTNWTNNKVVCCTILFVLVCFFFWGRKLLRVSYIEKLYILASPLSTTSSRIPLKQELRFASSRDVQFSGIIKITTIFENYFLVFFIYPTLELIN